MDEARDYVADDLASAQSVVKYGYVAGVDAADSETPHRNLMNAPFWTDGRRIVLLLTDDRVPLADVDVFDWKWETDWPACESPVQIEPADIYQSCPDGGASGDH